MTDYHLTNPTKILYPEQGITKQQLADFYEQISDWILPYIINRPLMLLRCPEGRKKKCFYQKHIGQSENQNIYSIDVETKKTTESCLYIKDLAGLLALIQMGVLEIHCWGSTIDNIEKPDQIVFDLDPDEDIAWLKVQEAAVLLKNQLKKYGLTSFLKTSGGKGLHLVIPIIPDWPWVDVKDFTHAIAKIMEEKHPHTFISNMSKVKREGKIFIDYLRNGRGATSIAPYSTRAKKNASVATPIRWNELQPHILPYFYTISNLPKRLTSLKKDPWDKFFKIDQQLKI